MNTSNLEGEITSISINQIKFIKALLNKDIEIGSVKIGTCDFKGKNPFSSNIGRPAISGVNLKIDSLILDEVNLNILGVSNSNNYIIKNGVLHIFDVLVEKNDTLDFKIIKQYNFAAKELVSVSSDSMYSYKLSTVAIGIYPYIFSTDSFSIHPNYNDYNFNVQQKFQTDRFEVVFKGVLIHDFSPIGFLNSGNLICSYVKIGKMDLKVYRDKRKIFNHVSKPAIQDMINNYQGKIKIDSIVVLNGKITYTEQVKKEDEPGMISFDRIKVRL